jgi:hypothetical protein
MPGTFRFFAMPAYLNDERAGRLEDIQDTRFDYRRATPEKALLDWIYLGASPRIRMTRPPFDLNTDEFDVRRLKRLARAMNIKDLLAQWQAMQIACGVETNASTWLPINFVVAA